MRNRLSFLGRFTMRLGRVVPFAVPERPPQPVVAEVEIVVPTMT
jgi:hypothetical protein